jgi:hypothetical protein
MDKTRHSMSQTVDEIKDELSQALRWQTYLNRYPGAFLIGGGLIGFMIGRAVKGSDLGESLDWEQSSHQAIQVERSHTTDTPTVENNTLRRIADMATSALIAQVVPVLSSKLKRLLGPGPSTTSDEAATESSKRRSWLH